MITNNKIIFIALILFSVNFVFAKPEFSLSWENSFLTGKVNIKDELPVEIVDIDKSTIGGQSLLVLRCKILKVISIGIGSGANVSKLNFSYDEDAEFYDYLEDSGFAEEDSLPMFYVPFFGEIILHLPLANNAFSIYGGTKIGNSISPPTVKYYGRKYSFDKGLFLEPTFGFSFNIRRFLLDLGVAYHLQKSGLIEEYYDETNKYKFELKQFVAKLGMGIRFGKIN